MWIFRWNMGGCDMISSSINLIFSEDKEDELFNIRTLDVDGNIIKVIEFKEELNMSCVFLTPKQLEAFKKIIKEV